MRHRTCRGYWWLLLPTCFVPTLVGLCIDGGFVACKKTSFLSSSPGVWAQWLKQGNEFITSGQCNYLGSGHMIEINMTQSTQPLTLIHDKVRRCLSIERSGLLDFVSLLLFWFTVGHGNIRKEPLFYKRGKKWMDCWSRTYGESQVRVAAFIS